MEARSCRWLGVRFCFPHRLVINSHTFIRKEVTRTSIVLAGSGGRHFDFALSLEGVLPSSCPAKNVLRPMSRSFRTRDGSTLEREEEWRGVGMNLRPRPRRQLAAGGNVFHFVRSWITPARSWRLVSHPVNRRRSWSMTPSIRLAVTQAFSAWHFRFLTFTPCQASWAPTAFTSATRGVRAQASGNTQAAMVAATATASGAGGGQGGWNHHRGGHRHLGGRCPLSIGAAVAEAAAGEGKEARMTVARQMRTSQTWQPGAAVADTSCRGRSRSNSLCTSSGEGKRQWVMNDGEFEDARNPMMAAAAADGNKDDDKNDSDDDDDRRTSSALISL